MNKETYERLSMDVTKFDVEDVITTSGTADKLEDYELPIDLPINI